jgi:hypothetical protein
MRNQRSTILVVLVACIAIVGLFLFHSWRNQEQAEPSQGTNATSPAAVPLSPQREMAQLPAAVPTEPVAVATPLRTEPAVQSVAISNEAAGTPTPDLKQTPFQREVALQAASGNWSNILARISSGELDPNMVLVPANGNNLLRIALTKGGEEAVAALLAAGAKPGTREAVIAAGTGNLPMLQQLAVAGASMNVWDEQTGQSPFVQAVRGGNLEMADWLLQHGASLEPNPVGVTPLDECVASGKGSVATIQYLEKLGLTLSKQPLSMIHPSNPQAGEILNYISSRVGN